MQSLGTESGLSTPGDHDDRVILAALVDLANVRRTVVVAAAAPP